MVPNLELRDVVGSRGESIAELALTEYSQFSQSLFQPGFLGDKWPSVDFYVELNTIPDKRPYFFVQVKTTSVSIRQGSSNLTISSKKTDIKKLLEIPGPTYIIGVHEPTRRSFIRSVHLGLPVKGITRIPVANELTPANLRILHAEVLSFWTSTTHKPTTSCFT